MAGINMPMTSEARAQAGLLATGVRLARTDGVLALWRGLQPTLVMSIPGTIVYMTAYEAARDALSLHVPSEWAPLLAGGSARLVASTLVSPIELVRTRIQASHGPGGLLAGLRAVLVQGGLHSLWGGLAATLWRDVPFSCLYWFSYEALKRRMQGRSQVRRDPPGLRVASA